MPETFDHATTNPGSGGTNLAGDAFSQGGVPVFLPACYLVFGPADGPYTRVDSGAGLPVSLQNSSIAVTGPLTDAQLRASAVPVTGTFWQATQPVSGPLTDSELRASAVPVSGTFWQATQPVSGPLTDAQLRASAVPVSGSFSLSGSVDTELPAAAALADTAANPTAPAVGAFGMLWDGSTGWDREPAPQGGSLLGSAPRNVTTASVSQTNRGHRGVIVFLNITAAAGGQSLTLNIEGFDVVSSNWCVLVNGVATTANGLTGVELSPGAGGATIASNNLIAVRSGGLPRNWRVNVIHSGGAVWTYSVGYQLLR
jgi:hypothetical protein